MPAHGWNRTRAKHQQEMTNTTSTPRVHLPIQEEAEHHLSNFFAQVRRNRDERRVAVAAAIPALERLCRDVLTQRSGQCYKVRALLYSLYNGQPTCLLEIVALDWNIRQDLCAVLLAFGHEENPHEPGFDGQPQPDFFCEAMKDAITAAGQWDWFCEAHEEESEVAA